MEFLNSGNEEILVNLTEKNENYYITFECAYAENNRIVAPYKCKVDTIYNEYEILKNRNVILKTTENKSIPINSGTAKKAKNNSIPKENFRSISEEEIISYTEKLKNNLLKYTSDNKELNKVLLDILDFDDFKDKKLSDSERSILNFKISYGVYLTLKFLYKKIDYKPFKFNYFVPIVIPENYWVKQNEYYKAQLGFTFIDTIHNFSGIIEDDSIYFKKSIAYYTNCPDSIGIYKKTGNVLIESPSTGELKIYPFDIEFKVTKNE